MRCWRFVAVGLGLVGLAPWGLAGCGPPGTHLTLHPASAMVRIGGPGGVDRPAPGYSYVLELAMNEGEAFQVQVARFRPPLPPIPSTAPVTMPVTLPPPVDRPPLSVTVQVEPDVPAGWPPPEWRPRIDVFEVLDVHHTGPGEHPVFHVPSRNLGWVPDLCLPGARATAPEYRPDAVTFLFDVRTPPGPVGPRTQRFDYRLSFESRGDPEEEFSAPVTLYLTVLVRPFALPRRLPFRTAVTWNWGIEKYLGRPLTGPERRAYLDFFLDCRLTPASFFTRGPELSEQEIRHVVARGGNAFQLFHVPRGGGQALSEQEKSGLADKVRQWRQVMKAAGALQDCYALLGDEPQERDFPAIRSNAEWLKGLFPEVKVWVATRPNEPLLDVVDCWDAVLAHSTEYYAGHSFTPDSLLLARSVRGRPRPEYWWFLSVEPYAPHPNVRVDDALPDARAVGWMSFEQGVDGFEYFWATDWADNAPLRDVPYPDKARRWLLGLSGAGVLCYPGPDGRPVPSLRLINLRDGMEDWAALVQAGAFARGLLPMHARSPVALAAARGALYKHLSEHEGR